jgi:hypothetical protein
MGAYERLNAVRGKFSPSTASRIHGGSVTGPAAPGGALGEITGGEFKHLAVVALVTCTVRPFRLGGPSSVIFDEIHFGKVAAKYMRVRPFTCLTQRIMSQLTPLDTVLRRRPSVAR